jgi:hypothetical protein
MSQQAYILKSTDGTYIAASNGGQALRLTPCETLDDVARYVVNSQRIPVRDLPPYFDAENPDWRPISDYDFAVLKTLVTKEEADEITEKSESQGFLSGLSSRIPVLMTILRIK